MNVSVAALCRPRLPANIQQRKEQWNTLTQPWDTFWWIPKDVSKSESSHEACSLEVGLFTRLLLVLTDCKTSHWVYAAFIGEETVVYHLPLNSTSGTCLWKACVSPWFVSFSSLLSCFLMHVCSCITQQVVTDARDRSINILSDPLHLSKLLQCAGVCRFILNGKHLLLRVTMSAKVSHFPVYPLIQILHQRAPQMGPSIGKSFSWLWCSWNIVSRQFVKLAWNIMYRIRVHGHKFSLFFVTLHDYLACTLFLWLNEFLNRGVGRCKVQASHTRIQASHPVCG